MIFLPQKDKAMNNADRIEFTQEQFSALRFLFEHEVYKKYFVSQVERKSDSGPFALWTRDDTVNMETFIRRDRDGHYEEEGLEPAWWGFRQAAKCSNALDEFARRARLHGWPKPYPWEEL